MVGRRGKDDPEGARAPGWYPDPWSATGEGERYFDGKKWGTSAKPLGRHSTADNEPSTRLRPPTRLKPRSRWRRRARAVSRSASTKRSEFFRKYGPVTIFVVLVALVWGLPKLFHHSGNKITITQFSSTPSTNTPPSTIDLNRPPASPEEQAKPLGHPAPVPAGNGKFEVEVDQPGDTSVPVAWDPCRPIHYVVNPTGAPSDGAALITSAIARVEIATGLHFIDDGTTTEQPSKDRSSYQPKRYPKRWAPVLIAWSDEGHYPGLAGYITGIGSPQPEYADNTHMVIVTGQIVLDRQDLSRSSLPFRAIARATILHELGHLVGLDHTADRRQIMYSESQFNVLDYAQGDRLGLAKLGTQACFRGM